MNTKLIKFVVSLLLFAPCFAVAQPSDHGEVVKLGSVTVASQNLMVTKLGAVEPGKEAAFQVDPGEGAKQLADLNVYLWVEDAAGKQISAPGKGIPEGGALHFHVTPKAGTVPSNVVVRVRADGKDEKASLSLAGVGPAADQIPAPKTPVPASKPHDHGPGGHTH